MPIAQVLKEGAQAAISLISGPRRMV